MVNTDGEVLIFVDIVPSKLSYFAVDGLEITLSGFGIEPFRRNFGPLILHAASRASEIVAMSIDEHGNPVEMKRLFRNRR